MKLRVQIYSVIDNLSHAQTIRDNFSDQLIGKDIFELASIHAGQNDDREIIFCADIVFNSRGDRNILRDWLMDKIETDPVIRTWILSAKLSWHDCTHDDPEPRNCRVVQYEEWRR